MLPATPQLHLETLFVLDSGGQIVSTREPQPSSGPLFVLIRGASSLAWAARADVADDVAGELGDLARQEPPSLLWEPPLHAQRYQAVLPGRVSQGLAFEFPEVIDAPTGVVSVHDEALLQHHFSGWVAGEIEAGRSPAMAVSVEGYPVSVCCCARRSSVAAEAGLETATTFPGARLCAPRDGSVGRGRAGFGTHAPV